MTPNIHAATPEDQRLGTVLYEAGASLRTRLLTHLVRAALRHGGPLTIDELARASGRRVRDISDTLSGLVRQRLVQHCSGGKYRMACDNEALLEAWLAKWGPSWPDKEPSMPPRPSASLQILRDCGPMTCSELNRRRDGEGNAYSLDKKDVDFTSHEGARWVKLKDQAWPWTIDDDVQDVVAPVVQAGTADGGAPSAQDTTGGDEPALPDEGTAVQVEGEPAAEVLCEGEAASTPPPPAVERTDPTIPRLVTCGRVGITSEGVSKPCDGYGGHAGPCQYRGGQLYRPDVPPPPVVDVRMPGESLVAYAIRTGRMKMVMPSPTWLVDGPADAPVVPPPPLELDGVTVRPCLVTCGGVGTTFEGVSKPCDRHGGHAGPCQYRGERLYRADEPVCDRAGVRRDDGVPVVCDQPSGHQGPHMSRDGAAFTDDELVTDEEVCSECGKAGVMSDGRCFTCGLDDGDPDDDHENPFESKRTDKRWCLQTQVLLYQAIGLTKLRQQAHGGYQALVGPPYSWHWMDIAPEAFELIYEQLSTAERPTVTWSWDLTRPEPNL